MLGWSICYAGTLPLVNTALFRHMNEFAGVFPGMSDVSGTVFIQLFRLLSAVAVIVSGWRRLAARRATAIDAMVLSAVLGVVSGSLLLAPAGNGADQGVAIVLFTGIVPGTA